LTIKQNNGQNRLYESGNHNRMVQWALPGRFEESSITQKTESHIAIGDEVE
jgi:hypothetical protein